jgi:PAS domain-containing protein
VVFAGIPVSWLAVTYARLRLRVRADDAASADDRSLLRTLMNALPDVVYVKDTDSRFLVANEAVARGMGTTVDNLLGKTDFDFFPEDLARVFVTTNLR